MADLGFKPKSLLLTWTEIKLSQMLFFFSATFERARKSPWRRRAALRPAVGLFLGLLFRDGPPCPQEGAPQPLNSARPSWFSVSSLQRYEISNPKTWFQCRDRRFLNPLGCLQGVSEAGCHPSFISVSTLATTLLCDLEQAEPLWVVAFPSVQ